MVEIDPNSSKRMSRSSLETRRACILIVLILACIGASTIAVAPSAGQALPGSLQEPGPGDTEVVGTVPDSLLAARLSTIFSNIGEFEDVAATVTEGVVRLRGSVDQPENRREAEELAASIEGVVYVVNDVLTSTDVETRITPAVTKIQEYWDGLISQLPVLAVALIVVLLFGLASMLLGRWSRPPAWWGINPMAWGFVRRFVRSVLVLLGLLLAFDILGITSLMGAVLGTAGIVGLALGFAFQDIVENYLAGMLLSLRRPFSVNDLVRIGEFEGKIVRMTSRELVLMTLEGNHVRLPNAHVFKSAIINYTINPRRLFSFDVGIGVPEDLQTAMAIGVESLKELAGVMHDPAPFARVTELGESSVNVRFHGWVDQREADFLIVRSEAVRRVKEALDDAAVELPEPIYRILVQSASDRKAATAAGVRHEVKSAPAADVRPDGKIDEQVREDLEHSEEENLLE